MTEDEKSIVCEGCRRPLSSEDRRTAVFAFKQIDVTGFNTTGQREYADGLGSWFHEFCFPGGRRWRATEPPSTV